MKLEQCYWTTEEGWESAEPGALGQEAQLVFVFGATEVLEQQTDLLSMLQARYTRAQIVGCSTAGEIAGDQVFDHSLTVTAVHFAHARIEVRSALLLKGAENSAQAGASLAREFDPKELKHLFVISEGLHINGSELVEGISKELPAGVSLSGGLAGDGARFGRTFTLRGQEIAQRQIIAIGFYGERLTVDCGSMGGWDPFGPERLVTRSTANILYELDGQSALALYKKYLGEHAAGLPATGLLYPLSLSTPDGKAGVVRTILAIDEQEQSLTFAGDVPEGSYARLMCANFDRLVDGAIGAAKACAHPNKAPAELAILVSCVGRKLLLKQRIEEEVEGARDVLGQRATFTGFYSYGEISHFNLTGRCELHNQTMTITVLRES